MTTITLEDLYHTEALGRILAASARRGDVYLLSGELGAGKTSLCRAFLREFTGDYDMDVPSPSYLITLQYSSGSDTTWSAYHIDPFRLSEGSVSCLIDFDEAVKKELLLIEWPSRLGSALDALIAREAGRVMRIDFGGVGPQAQGRQVTLSVARESEEQWLSDILRSFDECDSLWDEKSAKQICRGSVVSDIGHPTSLNYSSSGFSLPANESPFLVMGIESSCDDTAVAIVRSDGTVVAESIASQSAVHQSWGGVVPKIAQEMHAVAISSTVEDCLRKAGGIAGISAISVTVGPGLALCLQVGVQKAIELSAGHQIPLIRIHHMEAHMMVTRLPGMCDTRPEFPFVTLLVSGGHTMIVLTKDIGDHVILGSTIDDSVGEAFDKTARLLGITTVPAGRELEALASDTDPSVWQPALPRPLTRTRDDALRKGCDMSFAGLKTAVRTVIEQLEKKGEQFDKSALASAFQHRCAEHLADKLENALRIVTEGGVVGVHTLDDTTKNIKNKLSHVVVAGGVAANKTVKRMVANVVASFGLTLCVPPPAFCTDNGVMVAWTGIERYLRGLAEPPMKIKNLDSCDRFTEVRARWPLGVRFRNCKGKINDTSGKSFDRKARDMSSAAV